MIFEGTCVESPRRFAAHAPSGTIFHLWRLAIACAASSMSGLSRSEEHTSELQSRLHLVCRLLLEKKKHAATRIAAPKRTGFRQPLRPISLTSQLPLELYSSTSSTHHGSSRVSPPCSALTCATSLA